MNAKQTFYLGTAIKITTVLSLPTPDSVKITIYDSSKVKKVTSADMNKEMNTVYSYIYQTVDDGVYGEYIVHIDAVYGAYTARMEELVTLNQLLSV